MNNDGADRGAQTTRLEELLAPWHSSIREATVPCANSMRPDSRGCLWVRVKHVPRMAALEGFELLALLAYADWPLWKSQVRVILPLLTSDWENEEDATRPTSAGIELLVSGDQESDELLERVVVAAHTHNLSPAFVEARAILLAVIAERGHAVAEIPVRLVCDKSHRLDMLFKILQAVVLQQRFHEIAPRAAPRCYVGLRFRTLCLSLKSTLDARPLQNLLDIVAMGVDVDEFSRIISSVYRDHPRLHARGMTMLYAEPSRVHMITFNHPVNTVEMVPCIWAAIRRSATLQSVRVELSDDQSSEHRTVLLQWVMYALFSGGSDSYHRIQSLTLGVNHLNSADVDLVRQVLHTENPLAILLSCSIAETISASRFSLLDPTGEERTASGQAVFESGQVLHHLAVLAQTPPWTTVFLPGWGRAWIHRGDIQSTQLVIPGPLLIQSIANVTIRIKSAESQDAVMNLLCLIGRGIRDLSIWCFSNEQRRSDHWCRRLLQACPKLERLFLYGVGLDSVQVFTDGYTSGTCRLRRLSIRTRARTLTNDEGGLFELFQALGDRHHPAARFLCELFISQTAWSPRPTDPSIVPSLVHMLERNRQLHRLCVHLARLREPVTEAEVSDYISPVLAFNSQRIIRRLDLKQRLAFLSAVTPHSGASHRGDQLNLVNLDVYILSLIFEFAAKSCKRCVEFTCS